MPGSTRKLDIPTTSLKAWLAQSKQDTHNTSYGVAKLNAEQLRIREFEHELTIARELLEIIKNTTAFFAKAVVIKQPIIIILKKYNNIPHLFQVLKLTRYGYEG